MKHSTERILTTHAGSLPRPHDLLDMMREKLSGRDYDEAAYDARVKKAVADIIQQQVDIGIDVVADGEVSKPGFFTYVQQRITGFEQRPQMKNPLFAEEVAAFPDYYEEYFKRSMLGGTVVPYAPTVCVGPVTYIGEEALKTDLENLKAATQSAAVADVFVPSTAPSGVGFNEYYKTEEEYFEAVGEALRVEYNMIVDAGFLLQVDDPFLADLVFELRNEPKELDRRANLFVETINHALRGIAPEKVRFHTCYGINDGPRLYEATLEAVAPYMLKVNAQAFSFEGANVRHETDYHVFETHKLKDGQILIPGVITHGSNMVEHPQLIAERLMRYTNLVGRENVIAGADCGFSSQATYKPEVNPQVMWEKFKALVEGAKIASQHLWK